MQAREAVHLADVQVYPNAAERKARVVVSLGNDSGKAGQGQLNLEVAEPAGAKLLSKAVEATWDAKGGKVEVELPLGEQAKLWDEFHPNLYELKVKLTPSAGSADTRGVRFGLRDFGVNGRQFTLNGRPICLRGEVESAIFPLTGYPFMDTDAWRRVMKVLKAHGMNHLRFHSWTPPEAAFVAADEEGIIFQVEAPQANVPQAKARPRSACSIRSGIPKG